MRWNLCRPNAFIGRSFRGLWYWRGFFVVQRAISAPGGQLNLPPKVVFGTFIDKKTVHC